MIGLNITISLGGCWGQDLSVVLWLVSGSYGFGLCSRRRIEAALNGILTHNTFWPQTGFGFIQQLSQSAMIGE